jgi:hypothetical protein
LLIKLIIDGVCGTLNALGGWHILFMRRYIMPCVIGVAVSYFSHTWWLGLCCLPAMGTLSLGYFGGKNSGRGLWLFLQAIALSSGCFFLHHLAWYAYVPYIIISGLLGGIYKNWMQIFGDLIAGIYLASFIFFIY